MNTEFTPEEKAQFDQMAGEPEPAVEETKPEAKVDEPDADGEDDESPAPRQQMVPHKALHSERERRKAAERQAAEFRQRLAYLEGMQQARQPQQQAPEIPDPEADPIAALKYQQDFIRRQQEQQAQYQQQAETQRRQQEFVIDVAQEWDSFRKATPGADEAYQHVLTARDRELALMGYAPHQRKQIINGEEFQAMVAARREGRSIGEYVVEIAKARGWSQKAPTQPLKDGREASRSLSGVGSGAAGPMTAERLAAMPMKDFEAYQAKNPDAVRRLMGG